MNKSRKIGAAAVVSAAAAAIMLSIPAAATAKADDGENAFVELDPVSVSEGVAYNYFDAPTAVHAEPSGIHVSCGDGVVSVTVEQENGISFSEPKNMLAQKAYKSGECFITLNDGVLYSYYGIDPEPVEYSGVYAVDFDVAGSNVYAVSADELSVIPIVDDALDVANAYTVQLNSRSYKNIRATAVAATENDVYIALSSSTAPYRQDVAHVDKQSGALSPVLFQSDEIMSITVMGYSDTVYTLTRDRITGYAISGGALKQKYVSLDARMTDIYAYDGYIYAIDTLGALYKVSGDLETYTVLAASASAEEGFFNSPAGAAVKNSTLFVADSVNNRIAQYGDEGLTYADGEYNYPVSVACDSRGTLYVAHDFNKVSYGNAEFTVDGSIKQLAVDADKRIYVLSDAGLWVYKDANSCVKISDAAFKAIAIGVGHDELYALGDNSVYKFTENDDGSFSSAVYCDAPAEAFSLAVDFKRNAYLLSASGVTRVDKESSSVAREIPLYVDGKPYGVEGGQILLSTVGNDYVDYGSAVIVDTYKHRVFSVSGDADALDIRLIESDDYEVPDRINDRTPEYYGDGLIRTALYDVPVFSLPRETPEIYLIKRGRKVIVPEYNLADSHWYSLILIDDTVSHKLIQGYVYKDALSDALEYVPPPSSAVTPFSGATPVYKWPSPHSKTVADYSPVLTGDSLSAIEFVDDYRDYRNNLWYRVKLGDDFEGFMMAADVSLGEYETTRIRPAYNAKIISYKNSEFAQAYILKDDEYVAIDIKLDTGTEVEVVDAFDTSEKYTKIKCLTENGTVTCYVETVYVDYEGVNVVLLVAIIVIIITVVLLAVIIARVVYLKKKRLTTPDDEGGATAAKK